MTDPTSRNDTPTENEGGTAGKNGRPEPVRPLRDRHPPSNLSNDDDLAARYELQVLDPDDNAYTRRTAEAIAQAVGVPVEGLVFNQLPDSEWRACTFVGPDRDLADVASEIDAMLGTDRLGLKPEAAAGCASTSPPGVPVDATRATIPALDRKAKATDLEWWKRTVADRCKAASYEDATGPLRDEAIRQLARYYTFRPSDDLPPGYGKSDATASIDSLLSAVGHKRPGPNGGRDAATRAEQDGDGGGEGRPWRIVKVSEIEARAVEWLWHHRIVASAFNLLAGDGDVGKSQLTYAIAAAVTRGDPLPGDDAPPLEDGPGNVLILSDEEHGPTVVRPRLEAAGADLDRCAIVELRESWLNLALEEHREWLREMIREHHAALVIIDPTTSYIGRTDANTDNELRTILGPLGKLAEECSATLVGIIHLNKGDKAAKHRIMGSVAWVNAPRSVLMAAIDPNDPTETTRVLVLAKHNLTVKQPALEYSIERVDLSEDPHSRKMIVTSRVKWGGLVSRSLEEVFPRGNRGGSGPSKRERACDLLGEALADEPRPVSALQSLANAAGISWRTMETAKSDLGVESDRDGFGAGGGWYWRLPGAHTRGE